MGITVGQVAPEFTLKDQNQQEVKLADFKGKKNVVLMFTRWTGARCAPTSTPAWSAT